MPDGHTWEPDHFQAMWAKFRAVFEAVGLTDHLVEIDELAANGSMMLGARDTWWFRFGGAIERLSAALPTVDPARVSAVMPAVHELGTFVDELEKMRCARARAYVATPRGVAFCQFLLAAQMKLQDGALSAMAPHVPATVLQAVSLELRDALHAPEVERRMRALAAATKTTMESYYRPTLKGVWTLSALMVGKQANNPPAEIGSLFKDLEEKIWPNLPAPWPTDFIDKGAKFVRNAVAHEGIRFDACTSELVLKNRGTEQRLTEPALRQRLGSMFERTETMRSAFLYATGQLDPVV
jgi:hypothetical protein